MACHRLLVALLTPIYVQDILRHPLDENGHTDEGRFFTLLPYVADSHLVEHPGTSCRLQLSLSKRRISIYARRSYFHDLSRFLAHSVVHIY